MIFAWQGGIFVRMRMRIEFYFFDPDMIFAWQRGYICHDICLAGGDIFVMIFA